MKHDKTVTVAFTGHRYIDASLCSNIRDRLTATILDAYEHGFRNFISGFAIGFDMMAAEIVVSLRETHEDMTLTAAIPFRGQSSRFNYYDQQRYDRLIREANEVLLLSESYYPRCFLERDAFMVDNSSMLIAYYDGRERGGTFYTVKKADRNGVPVVNVY
jgi:uncharacterized phage-like protein YoqJ